MHLLFFSDIPWEHLFQRPQYLASRLAQQRTVLWIEPVTLGAARKWKPVRRDDGIIVLSLPQFPHNARHPALRRLSRTLSTVPLLRTLLLHWQVRLFRRACRLAGIDPAVTPAVVQNFQFAPLVGRVRPSAILFDYIDDAFGFVDQPAYVRTDWQRMVDMADVLTATSGVLQRQLAQAGNRTVHLIENGVAADLYDRETTRPSDLPAPGTPLAVYAGTIAAWFDLDLLEATLRALPGVGLVLIGPVHPDARPRLTGMGGFPNLHVLGLRPHSAIPAYLQAASAGVIPFVRNRLTEAVNPVKLYEYAAAGIPVVSTAFSDDLRRFGAVALVAGTHEEFITGLAAAVAEPASAERRAELRAFARRNDWSARAATMTGLLTAAGQHAPRSSGSI